EIFPCVPLPPAVLTNTPPLVLNVPPLTSIKPVELTVTVPLPPMNAPPLLSVSVPVVPLLVPIVSVAAPLAVRLDPVPVTVTFPAAPLPPFAVPMEMADAVALAPDCTLSVPLTPVPALFMMLSDPSDAVAELLRVMVPLPLVPPPVN